MEEHFAGEDFEVLAFPCNQFGLQEPGVNASEILNTIRYVRPGSKRGYPFEPRFPLTRKVEVNGDGQEPIYRRLKVHFFF